MEPRILAQDENWVLVDKPPFWLSVPPSQPQSETRLNLKFWLQNQGIPAFPVHRLDIETSGVILFAKNQAAHKKASQWFEQREVKKTYLFFAAPPMGRPWDPQALPPQWKIKKAVDGKDSLTRVETQRTWNPARVFSGLAHPLTGRRHQIRQHLASEGYPLLGDTEYGGDGESFISRVALHALALEFPEPLVGQSRWLAPIPSDLLALQQKLDQNAH